MADQPTFVVNDRRKFTSDGELRHDGPAATEHTAEPGGGADPSAGRDAPAVLSFPSATATQQPEQDVLDVSAPALDQLSDLPESGALASSLASRPPAPAERNETLRSSEQLQDGELVLDDELPPGPNPEESEQAQRAYEATVERLDLAMRSADPGAERLPPMSFERLTQSLYTQALLLLGGGTQPGEQPRIDILGARQTIDMLVVVAEKTIGNLSAEEDKLLQSALFDLRMGFLEITQALARQAAQRQPGGPGSFGGFGGAGTAGGFGAGMPGGPRIVR